MGRYNVERAVLVVREAQEFAQRRRRRRAEWNAFLNGAALTLTGWLLAVLYCLLSHQLAI
jgi:hypothetical protein